MNLTALDPDVLRRRRELVLTFLALFLVLGAAGVTAYGVLRTPPPTPRELAEVAQQAVRDAIPPAYSLDFSTLEEIQIAPAAEDHYSVSGRVVAVPRSGAAQSYVYTCSIARFNDKRWRPAKLSLQPQY
jgi:hypothetical protein